MIDLGDLQSAIAELGNASPDWLEGEAPALARAIDGVLYYHPRLPDAIVADTTVAELTRAVDGATFIDDEPEDVLAIWGEGSAVIWSDGEGLMLVGPDGVGKTTVGQQLALCRVGIRDKLLGFPVRPADGKVLYVAADRPKQAARSMRRMIVPADRELLRDRLVVWRGPLPFQLAKEPKGLVQLADDVGATDVVLDSLKDVQAELSKDEVGSWVNIAFQELIASGKQLLALHHQRKEQNNGTKPTRIADVYGSRWLTAGMGSVVLLWGEPGDLVVELRHLKQPEEDVGPLNVIHDHHAGRSTLDEPLDLVGLITATAAGLTVHDTAVRIFGTATPSRNEIEKARRRLEALVRRSLARRADDADGTARYFARHLEAVRTA